MTRSDWFWLAWALAGVISFLIAELYAVFSGHPGWKLSASVWRLEDYVGYLMVWRIIVLILLGWLAYHLFFGLRH